MQHSNYLPERMGTATVLPSGSFEAGSFQSFTLVYTAGYFGIDDTGSIKIVHRFASDMGRPQWTDPAAPNYTTVIASNGAILDVQYDGKRNIRPWDKTLFIRVARGFLREGDQIIVCFGDRSGGSPGMRIQTFVEPTFEFRVLADPFATYHYTELVKQPFIAVVAGPPVTWKAILPTIASAGIPGYEFSHWNALYGPSGMDAASIKRINELFVSAMKKPAVKKFVEENGMEVSTSTPDGLSAFQNGELKRWGQIIKESGIQPE